MELGALPVGSTFLALEPHTARATKRKLVLAGLSTAGTLQISDNSRCTTIRLVVACPWLLAALLRSLNSTLSTRLIESTLNDSFERTSGRTGALIDYCSISATPIPDSPATEYSNQVR